MADGDALVPVLSVFKNGVFLHTILLQDPSKEEEDDEILMVGRHPDCHIVVDHPSISRRHLKIHLQRSSPHLLLTDLSSVHGTWICGERATPNVMVRLGQNDTFRLGASTRVYKLHWVPFPSAFEGENSPFSSRVLPPNEVQTSLSSETNKEEYGFDDEKHEQTLKEDGHVAAVESDIRNLTPIASGHDKEESGFDDENKKQTSREDGHVEDVESERRNPMQNCLDDVSKQSKEEDKFSCQTLKEEECFEAAKSVPRNLNPIVPAIKSEPDKEETEFAVENNEKASKEERDVNATETDTDMKPIVAAIKSEPNKEETEFAVENNEKASKEERDVNAAETDTDMAQITLESISVSNKQDRGFVDPTKEQLLKEADYVETAVPLPWIPVKPSAPPLPDFPSPSQQHKTLFGAIDAQRVPIQKNQSHTREKNGVAPSNLWTRRQKPGNLIGLQTGHIEMNLNPKKTKEKQLKFSRQKRIFKEISSAKNIKENHLENDKKNKVLDEKKRVNVLKVLKPETSGHGSSSTGIYPDDDELYPSDKENWTPKASGQALKKTAVNMGSVGQDIHFKTETARAPFQSLSQNSRVNRRPPSSSSLNSNRRMENHQGSQSEAHSIQVLQVLGGVESLNLEDSKRKWHMVIDTGCLINSESWRALKRLEGIRGTHLIIPRIVIRELDCLKRHNTTKKGNDAPEILRWIEDCMVNKDWWIHVQSSAECFSVGITPPASPQSSYQSDGSNNAVATAFSSYGSFADVLSPTAEDHILECALLFKRLTTDGQVVLLSNDVALKIKAMAEGMECENAKEFCESLISPYSERFLWSQSTAHGHNWTHFNRNTSSLRKKSSLHQDEESRKKSNENAKGLKLILLHNSHYGQKNSLKIVF